MGSLTGVQPQRTDERIVGFPPTADHSQRDRDWPCETLSQGNCMGGLVGNSKIMQEMFSQIRKIAQSRCSVLICGETGTGKELVARSIHQLGPDWNKPFITVDCGGIAPTLIESELFGHVRGAFTGADSSRQGLFEAARGGTVFLDEVAELPLPLQSRLLRACQEGECRPLGSTRPVRFEARILAATNQDLGAAVTQGSFRRDLFFRLNVVSLYLPPLRERKEDIPVLASEILRKLSTGHAQRPALASRRLSEEAAACLLGYDWPGNVRELENCLWHALTLGDGPVIQAKDLPIGVGRPSTDKGPHSGPKTLRLAEMERQAILQAIEDAGGDKQLAAKLLGIGKTTLYRKLKEYSQRTESD